MTSVDEAITRLRALPPADTESAAESFLAIIEQYESPYHLTHEQIEQVRQTCEGLENGTVQIASPQETEDMWRRLGATDPVNGRSGD